MVTILSIVQYGLNCMGYTGFQCLIFSPIWAIAMHACALFFGIYFAQNIGARLLLLDEQYNFMTDIFKPAVIAGVAYAVVALMINLLAPIREVQNFFGITFLEFVDRLLYNIRFDLFVLLFCLSGLAFVIKKIAKNVSMSVVMSISVGLILLSVNIPVLFDCFVRSNCPNMVTFISFANFAAMYVLLSAFFWKKGLEVALICHVVIVTVLYMSAPVVALISGV